MEITKDTVVTLENSEKYIIENITFYGGVKYALAHKENTNDKVIMEEILENNELFIRNVVDPELIEILMRILEG